MLEQLNSFFRIVEQMSAVETSGVEPLYTPLAAVQEAHLRLRDDEVTEVVDRDANQRSAPAVARRALPRAEGDRVSDGAPHELGVAALGAPLAARELSSVEVTSHLLDRFAAHERLGAALVGRPRGRAGAGARRRSPPRRGGAGAAARRADRAQGHLRHPRRMPTTAGSRMLAGYRSPFDATVVARLAEAGTVTLGKLNCDEFAMGSSTENSAFHGDPQPLGRERACPAARRAARRPRSRRACCPRRPAPTPAARSASRRASAASPASSRPTASARATE